MPSEESVNEHDPNTPLHVGGDVIAPVKISGPQPVYTEAARKAGIEGVVIVQARIDAEGSVTSTKILRGLPLGLSEESVKAVDQWKFQPATLNGRRVAVYYNLSFTFKLK